MQEEIAKTESSRPLNVIWRRAWLDHVLEGHFIKEVLLGKMARPIRTVLLEENSQWPMVNDALIVIEGDETSGYLRDVRSRGLNNIGIFHMGDEYGTQDRKFYTLADYVIRHYWFEHALVQPSKQSLGAIWVPNGYRTGVGPVSPEAMLPIALRTIMGFFAGVLMGRKMSAERAAMAAVVRDAKLPFIVVGTPGFGQGLGPVSYASCLASSRFALVPGGESPETVRLYDAMETGAIPIMLKSPCVGASSALGSPPFVLLDSWRELPDFYSRYADAMAPHVIAELEAKRREVTNWWTQFKVKQQSKVRDLVDLSFKRTYG
jgi:hypothetical protein